MRARQLLTACAAMAALLQAPLARAQAVPAPPPATEPVILTFGSLQIRPAILLRNLGVDENVFSTPENPSSDFTFTVAPRASVVYEPGRLRATLVTATDYVYFHKYASERGINQRSSGRVDLDLGVLRPWVSAAGTSTRERTSPEIDVRARYHETSYSGGLIGRFASRTSAGITYKQTTTTFDEGTAFRGQDLATVLNSRTDTVEGSLGFELTPLTSFSIVAGRDRQRFNLETERDSTSWRLTPTVTFHPGGLLSGSFALGVRRLHSTTGALPDYSGVSMQGDVATSIGGRYRLALNALRDVRYSYDPETPYFLLTMLTGTVQAQMSNRWDVLGIAGRQLLGYRARTEALLANPGTDRQRTLGGGVGYYLRPTLRLGLQADWTRRTSPRSELRAYTDRRIFTTITWGAAQ